jgi:hypothetical protein
MHLTAPLQILNQRAGGGTMRAVLHRLALMAGAFTPPNMWAIEPGIATCLRMTGRFTHPDHRDTCCSPQAAAYHAALPAAIKRAFDCGFDDVLPKSRWAS